MHNESEFDEQEFDFDEKYFLFCRFFATDCDLAHALIEKAVV